MSFENAIAGLRQAEADLEKQLNAVRDAISALGNPGTRGGRGGRRRGPGRPAGATVGGGVRKKRKMSAAARKRISDAQKKRWAKQRAEKK